MTVRTRLSSIRKRVSLAYRSLTNPNNILKGELEKALRALGRRSPVYAGRPEPSRRIREPQWNYVELYRLGQTHYVLRRIVEAIIRECTRNGGEVEERFKSKCERCGTEFDKELDECECGGATRPPDPMQRKVLQAFIKNPNRDDEWLDLLASALRFELTCDDWYMYVASTPSYVDLAPFGYAESMATNALQVYVEDSRYFRIVADAHGRLGNEEYFCPACYDGLKADTAYDLNYFKKHGGRCPKCKGELLLTAYIWREPEATSIKARFGRNDIIHGNMCPQLPHLYGTPKAIGCLRELHITRHMSRHDLEYYATGHVAKMVVVTGMSQTELNTAISDAAQQAQNLAKRSVTTGQIDPPQLHTLFLAIDDEQASVTVVDAMPDPEKMQDLEKKRQYLEDICAIYGVTPKFEGIAEAGKQGVRMVIDVDNNVARMHQKGLTDVFDEQLWPRLGVTDWVWRFNEIEERDELLDARTKQLNVDTAVKAARAKMNVELEESGELKVSGVPHPPEPQPFSQGGEGDQADKGMEVTVPGESPSRVESPWQRAKEEGGAWLVREIHPSRSNRSSRLEGDDAEAPRD